MANIKSSAKRDEKSKELRAKNRADKTELKTMMKKFDAAVAEGDKDAAVSAYKVAVKETAITRTHGYASFLLSAGKNGNFTKKFPFFRLHVEASPACLFLRAGV